MGSEMCIRDRVPGRIWESNTYMLAAAVRQAGGSATRHRAGDDPEKVLALIGVLSAQADLLITSGGVRGVQFRGRRFDTGNPVDYLRTIIQFALERRDVAAEFLPWLRKYLDDLP